MIKKAHVKQIPRLYSLVHPRDVDRGNGLQLWRVAVNTLNDQQWTA
jgi:hypothetical protein